MPFKSFIEECKECIIDNFCKIIMCMIVLFIFISGSIITLVGFCIDPKSITALVGIIIAISSAYVLLVMLLFFYICGDTFNRLDWKRIFENSVYFISCCSCCNLCNICKLYNSDTL